LTGRWLPHPERGGAGGVWGGAWPGRQGPPGQEGPPDL